MTTRLGEVTAIRRRFLDRLMGAPGLWAGVGWGLAEGTFFFLVPDILITLVALFSVKKSFQHTACVLAGSLMAGATMFLLATGGHTWVATAVRQVPFVREQMFERTKRDFEERGVLALMRGPSSGIPYKVYAVQAPRYTGLWPFLLVSIPARLERFILVWAGFGAAGRLLKKQIAKKPVLALAGHGLFWVGVYAYYWSAIK